jgi:site-specific DNA-methyltransferase (adenine-specific)
VTGGFDTGEAVVLLGDAWRRLREIPAGSVDAVVTDPPYGLGTKEPTVPELIAYLKGADMQTGGDFMGREWDVPPVRVWRECLRVLRPGGALLAFGGTRTVDLVTLGLRAAGFEIRDTLVWLHAQGFPKSLDASKAIDDAAGAEREVVGERRGTANKRLCGDEAGKGFGAVVSVTAPATEDARRWTGYGTALKPANEPIVFARKPLAGTVAENLRAHGTGAINIDGCRVGTNKDVPASPRRAVQGSALGDLSKAAGDTAGFDPNVGRFPANVLLSHAEGCAEACAPGCPVAALDAQSGERVSGKPTDIPRGRRAGGFGDVGAERGSRAPNAGQYGDRGGASRFFYTAKASRAERSAGLPAGMRNEHPTVKPVEVMRWLCRLVAPPGGLVLDPYSGSGTTGVAAVREGLRFLGVEREPAFAEIARARVAHALATRKG